MHGIVYLNENGDSVSPLFTWQDQRGNLIYKNGRTYAEYMSEQCGIPMATGYGLTTHFYNQENALIPKDAVTFCTIPDFIAMRFAQNKKPKLHPSMAASLGLYLLDQHCFDLHACDVLNINTSFFPELLSKETAIGFTKENIAVSPAFGDNQASFLGSVNTESNLLVNVGTGSQISSLYENIDLSAKAEYRPYMCNLYLITGSPLCGGHSYALMKKFLEKTLHILHAESADSIYTLMNAAAESVYQTENQIIFDTRLNGTRENPEITGSISNITEKTFTPEHFILGTLHGICNELYQYYKEFPKPSKSYPNIIGSGNGIRMNPLLQKIFEDTFSMKFKIPAYAEEAAYGVSLFSLYCSQYYKTLEDLQALIKY